jgi:molybdopterin-guanine dinucleotide biosynthesis protein A
MSLSAVLLAGGDSRRMGRDKATLSFRDKPLWQTQIDLLRSVTPEEILISARSEPAWRPSDCRFVADEAPSCGPLSGLAAALAEMRSTHLLALAIDMPFITHAYLRSLCDRIEPDLGLVPIIKNRSEPLAAIYPARARRDFRAALFGDDHSLQSLVANLTKSGRLTPVHVAPEEEKFFRNLNQPGDLVAR